jgi:vancomycin resistance protein VanW
MSSFLGDRAAIPKPRARSKLRLVVGRLWFTGRRFLSWHLSGVRFSARRVSTDLDHRVMRHRSVLLRELRNVEMWLQHNKVENLRLAIARLDGLILEPGEVFSYWRLIRKPTTARGFKVGIILFNGEIRQGMGGGLCQLSNLIYWLTLHTPLTVTERWRHSYDVFPDSSRTQPFGSGATCAYNYIDLQIANRTAERYQLRLWLDDKYLHGEWRADFAPAFRYEIVERDHLIRSEWWGGYSRHNKIFRKRFQIATDELVDEEFITANQALMMYSPLLPAAATASTSDPV